MALLRWPWRGSDGSAAAAEAPGPVAPAAPRPIPVLILGMHRSGTSFLAGSLQLAGLDLADASTSDKYNPKGNRENRAVRAFHDGVLAARRRSWRNPPPGPVTWTAAERAAAARLTARAPGDARTWGFKDPRTLLMAEEWLGLHPDARVIGIYRHPALVAESLRARFGPGFATVRALALWRTYNERLLAVHAARPFPILCFDEPEAALAAKLDALLPTLGLRPLGRDAFFAAGLRHHAAAPAALPPSLAPVHAALEARRC